MAYSNPETTEIKTIISEDNGLHRFELHIDGSLRASITELLNHDAVFMFYQVGGFHLSEATVWLNGVMELMALAKITLGIKDEQTCV